LFPKAATVPHLKPQPLWGLGSKRFGGRYTPKNSFETIYMAKDMVTALKEVQALISIPSGPAFTIVTVPWVTVAIQGFLSSVLDAVFPDRLRKPAYLEVYDPHGNVAQRLP